MTAVFGDANRHAEKSAQRRRQAFGVPRETHEVARVRELGVIGHRIAASLRARSDADQACDIPGEAVVAGTVEARRGLRLRPRAVEQQYQSLMEDVGEARERRIVMVAQAVANEIGQVIRQRAVRTEKTEAVND